MVAAEAAEEVAAAAGSNSYLTFAYYGRGFLVYSVPPLLGDSFAFKPQIYLGIILRIFPFSLRFLLYFCYFIPAD